MLGQFKYSFSKNSLPRRGTSTGTVCFANVRVCVTTTDLIMVALVLKYTYEKRVKRYFGSYRLIFLRLWRLDYLDIDDCLTEMIGRA